MAAVADVGPRLVESWPALAAANALSEEEKQGLLRVPGPIAASIERSMDDFPPRGAKPHRDATADEVGMYQRESFDVTTIPGPEGVLFVRFMHSAAAERQCECCRHG